MCRGVLVPNLRCWATRPHRNARELTAIFARESALTPTLSPRSGGRNGAPGSLLPREGTRVWMDGRLSSRILRLAAILALLAVLFAMLGPETAWADDLGEEQLKVERQLGCPICTDLPLNVCGNQICQDMKSIIHQKLAAGESPDQVVQYFVARYGEGVLLTPPQRGFSLAVWYLPVVAVLLGATIVGIFIRRSVHRQAQIDRRLEPADSGLDQYRQRVRREVEKLEETG